MPGSNNLRAVRHRRRRAGGGTRRPFTFPEQVYPVADAFGARLQELVKIPVKPQAKPVIEHDAEERQRNGQHQHVPEYDTETDGVKDHLADRGGIPCPGSCE